MNYINYNEVKDKPEVVKESYVIDYTSPTFQTLVMEEEGGFDYRWVYGLSKLSVKITSEGTNWWGQNVTTDILKDYTHQDRLGSTVNLSDQFGRVVGRADYNEWGEVTYRESLSISSSYRRIYPQLNYTGYDWDDVLGMYYAKARFYSADDKRFVAIDPVKGSITDPLSLVSYLYCVDNPLRYVDPLGTVTEEALNAIGFSLYVGMPHEVAFATIMLGSNFFLAGHQLAQAFTYKWLMNRGYSRVSLEQHMPSSNDRADVVAWRTNMYGQETIEIFEIKHRFQPYDSDFEYAQKVKEDALEQLGRYYDQISCMLNQRNTGEILVQSLYNMQIQYHLFSTPKANWFINLRLQTGNYIEYWFSYMKKGKREPQVQLATSPEYAVSQYRASQLAEGVEKEYQNIFANATGAITVTVGVVVGGTVMGLAIAASPAIAGGIIAAAEGVAAGVSAAVAATGEVLYQMGQSIVELLSTPETPSLALSGS